MALATEEPSEGSVGLDEVHVTSTSHSSGTGSGWACGVFGVVS
jgi:hypothetical protein